MKKTIIQFILKMLTLTGGLVSLLLLDSIISENITFVSGFILLLATAALSIILGYYSISNPVKSEKTKVYPKAAKQTPTPYYSSAKKEHTTASHGFHVA